MTLFDICILLSLVVLIILFVKNMALSETIVFAFRGALDFTGKDLLLDEDVEEFLNIAQSGDFVIQCSFILFWTLVNFFCTIILCFPSSIYETWDKLLTYCFGDEEDSSRAETTTLSPVTRYLK